MIKKSRCCDTNYCVVIPFSDKEDFLQAIDKIKETRTSIQPTESRKWFCDGMIIEREDYEKLLSKSKSIEILNELEGEED